MTVNGTNGTSFASVGEHYWQHAAANQVWSQPRVGSAAPGLNHVGLAMEYLQHGVGAQPSVQSLQPAPSLPDPTTLRRRRRRRRQQQQQAYVLQQA